MTKSSWSGRAIVSDQRIESLRVGQRDVVSVTLSGAADAGSILALLDDLERGRPAFVLIDETELKVGLITPADIQRIAQGWRGADHLRAAVIAVIAPSPVVYGLNRMFQLVSDTGGRLTVFRSRPAALEWLGDAGRQA